jgi:hypothetical protein
MMISKEYFRYDEVIYSMFLELVEIVDIARNIHE